eukprot:3044770-Prymnesium_polylepis.1
MYCRQCLGCLLPHGHCPVWTLGPKLRGKIHLFVGMSDTYYLNDAVYSLQGFLDDPATSPPSEATFDYGQDDGRGYEHCYSGNHGMPNQQPGSAHDQLAWAAADGRAYGGHGTQRCRPRMAPALIDGW